MQALVTLCTNTGGASYCRSAAMETKEPPESTSGAARIDTEPTELDPTESDSGAELEPGEDEPDVHAPEEDEPGGDEHEADDAVEAPSAPPVVAVVVTTGGPWLDAAIASLAAQDYPALSVLVLDNAAEDDPTARIAHEMPTAFVRRLPENGGFAAAAKEALSSVE